MKKQNNKHNNVNYDNTIKRPYLFLFYTGYEGSSEPLRRYVQGCYTVQSDKSISMLYLTDEECYKLCCKLQDIADEVCNGDSVMGICFDEGGIDVEILSPLPDENAEA